MDGFPLVVEIILWLTVACFGIYVAGFLIPYQAKLRWYMDGWNIERKKALLKIAEREYRALKKKNEE